MMGDIKESNNIPRVCRYKHLLSNDTQNLRNESSMWLTEQSNTLPIWSRLNSTNCAGQPRGVKMGKRRNYEIEIPDRLLSLFGGNNRQKSCMKKMEKMKNYHLLDCIFALCAALKTRFGDWSTNLLDTITTAAVLQYPKLLKKLCITDEELKISHLNQTYNFNGVEFEAKLQRVAMGYLYIRYGLNEFNLARALTWFFRCYQFGLIQCKNRSLVFGYVPDNDYGFFMYDCQSRGYPLFEDQQENSYILRTPHLQILLYCLVMTFNVPTEMCKFFIYNVNITILNPTERMLKKEIYIPTIVSAKEKVLDGKVDCGRRYCGISNKPFSSTSKIAKSIKTLNERSFTSLSSNGSKSKTKTSNIEDRESQDNIPCNLDQMHCIMVVPKQ